ncbi:MAG: glycosyltransferase family 4 protein [Nitrospira sp.]|jgi:glycosyltransferase involved in cell wall biosynthesis|nr:glycosyltransferase family 4 protein [Nitrospira sp.]
MGDLWAGAEVHLLALMTYLVRLHGFEWAVVLFNEGRLADELRKLPLSLTVIPEKHHGPLALASRLGKVFRQFRPDVVHTHKYKDSILAALVARYVGIPHVVRVVHGMPEPFKGLRNVKMAGYTIADRFVTGWLVDKVIAVSSDIEQALLRSYDAARIVCIHNGIDLEAVRATTQRADMRRKWNIDNKAVLIGTVGRLVPVKGHALLLEAFRILSQSFQNVILILVGDGPLREQLETEAKRLGLDQSVIFSGHQEQSYDFINMMDIFVLPSLHEGIPMVLLEAFALKRPVIASRVGGIPEVVSHGESGILVSPSNPDELAAAISALIEDQSKALAFGETGRCQVECEYSAKMMADRTASMYRTLFEN